MRKIKRRLFIALVIIAAAFVCIVSINIARFDVSYYSIQNSKLPEEFNDFKIAQI